MLPFAPLRSSNRIARKLVPGWWRRMAGALAVCAFGLALSGQAHAQDAAGVCRVSPVASAAPDGVSWGTTLSLVSALGNTDCQQIWLKQGSYTQNANAAGFLINRTVKLYGGFEGNETALSQRATDNSLTRLDGEGARLVLTVDGTAGNGDITADTVIDGLTITGGKTTTGNGGGMFCNGVFHVCSPSLNNVTFSGNSTTGHGGAMVNYGNGNGSSSSPSLNNVTFSGNSADGYGGAMFNYGVQNGTSSPSLSNVTFSGNSAGSNGGAMFNYGVQNGTSNPNLNNVTFSGNSTDGNGGAIYNYGVLSGTSNINLSNVTFSGNSAASSGGAMYSFSASNGVSAPVINNSIL